MVRQYLHLITASPWNPGDLTLLLHLCSRMSNSGSQAAEHGINIAHAQLHRQRICRNLTAHPLVTVDGWSQSAGIFWYYIFPTHVFAAPAPPGLSIVGGGRPVRRPSLALTLHACGLVA